MKNRLATPPDARRDAERDAEPDAGAAPQQSAFVGLLRQAEQFIAEHPKTTLGLGLALGVTLGWLIKRR